MLLYAVLLWSKPTSIFGVTFLSFRSRWHKINDKCEVFCMHGLCCLRSRLLQKVVLPPRQLNWWEIVFVRTTLLPLVIVPTMFWLVFHCITKEKSSRILCANYMITNCAHNTLTSCKERSSRILCSCIVETVWLQIVLTTMFWLVLHCKGETLKKIARLCNSKLYSPQCFDLYCITNEKSWRILQDFAIANCPSWRQTDKVALCLCQ